MSQLFGDPSCIRWWLANDEGYTPVLQSIRAFADERNAVAVTAQTEGLREIRHIFAKLELKDDHSNGGPGTDVNSLTR
jgi:phosphodiesterase/alkaline phosphatase D-like protein